MAIQQVLPENAPHPLKRSANSWTPRRLMRLDECSPGEANDRKLRGLLNKLTSPNFNSISHQITLLINKSENEKLGQSVRQAVSLILEQLTNCGHWPELYARLSKTLIMELSATIKDERVSDCHGGQLFRKHLLNRCQKEYEELVSVYSDEYGVGGVCKLADGAVQQAADGKPHVEAESKSQEDHAKKDVLLSDDFYAVQKAKRQGLALVQFFGELYKLNLLTERIMHECIKKLLENLDTPREEKIEVLCCLMTTAGGLLDHERAISHMNVYFSRMETMSKNLSSSSRARFMIMDLIDLRKNKWVKRGHEPKVESTRALPKATRQRPLSAPKQGPLKKQDTNVTLNNEQKKAFLGYILGQHQLGFRTSSGNLKRQGWTNVVESMNKRFNIAFEQAWFRSQRNRLHRTYLEVKFLRCLADFEWDEEKSWLTTDAATWERLLEASPQKRDEYELIRSGRMEWYSLAEQVFSQISAKNKHTEPPTDVARKNEEIIRADGDDRDVVAFPSTSVSSAREQTAQSEDDLMTEGIDSPIAEPLARPTERAEPLDDPTPAGQGPDQARPDPIAEAVSAMARMFLDSVSPLQYVKFIQVVENEPNAKVFLSLVSTTNPAICETWLTQKSLQNHS
ncbi:hypothetical protein PGT21_050285 [Puccinia graminis f. sp. tritici]|uniref:MIF4G domain-containing protein n=1 Tax=Puccinia graminis f. sp. tritici TaxID=56615 RepID=A0A5B0R4Q9_PUCGR|nr:hypothetical protein PGT21_050285 [Puccinia graminis f. sp. tritici]